MSPYSPIVTAELFIEAMGKEQQLLAKRRALAWRAAHRSTIDHSFITISGSSGIRRRVVVLTTTIASLEALPENVGYHLIPPLRPIWSLAATPRPIIHGALGRYRYGTKHFEAGIRVYVHKPHSGDGLLRTFLTGIHRDTKRYVTIMGATSHFEQWHASQVIDPIAIYELRYKGCGWSGADEERALIDRLVEEMNARRRGR